MLPFRFLVKDVLKQSSFLNSKLNLKSLIIVERFQSDNGNDFKKPLSAKYQVFRDEDSDIIYDVEEERKKNLNVNNIHSKIDENKMKFIESKDKSFNIEEIVELVKFNKAKDLIVLKLPPELKYVDFMVIASGISRRHLTGLAEIIRKEFKTKLDPQIRPPRIEGENSDWIALDLGNTVIHIMLDTTRATYDLESLWAIGPKFDLKLNTLDDNVLELLKQHTINLDDFQPAVNKPNI